MNLAPNGKPSNLTPEQYRLVRTPAFKKWFGDWENSPETASKVVDENGEPLVVWHTSPYGFNVFSFDYSDIFGWHFGTQKASNDILRVRLKNKGTTKPYFLNLRKKIKIKDTKDHKSPYSLYSQPYSLWQKLNIGDLDIGKKKLDLIKKQIQNNKKYDGFFYENKFEDIGSISWIVNNPNQIKLADGTNTTFDSSNPDIRFNTGGDVKLGFIQKNETGYYWLYSINDKGNYYKEIDGDRRLYVVKDMAKRWGYKLVTRKEFNEYYNIYSDGGNIKNKNMNIKDIISKIEFSEGLKQSLINDFISSGYEDVSELIPELPQKLPNERKIWAISNDIQNNVDGFKSGKNTYLQAYKIAEIILSEMGSGTPEVKKEQTPDVQLTENINIEPVRSEEKDRDNRFAVEYTDESGKKKYDFAKKLEDIPKLIEKIKEEHKSKVIYFVNEEQHDEGLKNWIPKKFIDTKYNNYIPSEKEIVTNMKILGSKYAILYVFSRGANGFYYPDGYDKNDEYEVVGNEIKITDRWYEVTYYKEEEEEEQQTQKEKQQDEIPDVKLMLKMLEYLHKLAGTKSTKDFLIGRKVKLKEMKGENMPEGLTGTISSIDDIGQFHISWENGSSLALIPDEDIFEVYKKGGEILIGGKGDKLNLEGIAKKHNVPLKYIQKQFLLGLKFESEHTDNKKMQQEIVKDHLTEFPNYYTALKKMETYLDKQTEDANSEERYIDFDKSDKNFLQKLIIKGINYVEIPSDNPEKMRIQFYSDKDFDKVIIMYKSNIENQVFN